MLTLKNFAHFIIPSIINAVVVCIFFLLQMAFSKSIHNIHSTDNALLLGMNIVVLGSMYALYKFFLQERRLIITAMIGLSVFLIVPFVMASRTFDTAMTILMCYWPTFIAAYPFLQHYVSFDKDIPDTWDLLFKLMIYMGLLVGIMTYIRS